MLLESHWQEENFLFVGANIMNRSTHYIFGDGYFCGSYFYLFLRKRIFNLQPIEADGYKKLLVTMSEKTESCENLL